MDATEKDSNSMSSSGRGALGRDSSARPAHAASAASPAGIVDMPTAADDPRPAGPPPGIPAGPPAGPRPAGPPPGIDPVSQVPNLAGFGQRYAQTVTTADSDDLAIWFVDVRSFRSINPQYGYASGNVVLQTIARCLGEDIAPNMIVGRVGGDRFVVLSKGISSEETDAVLANCSTRVSEEIAKNGITQPIVFAAGIYYLRANDYAQPNMTRALDYASKAHRSAHDSSAINVAIFSDEDLERDMRRLVIEQTIDDALIEGQIQVWYQPQVDYTLGEIVGAEALARWFHPKLGKISPTEFIPVLENCGKVYDLDKFIWEEACRSASRWRSVADGRPVPISVNISHAEVFEPGLMEHFLSLLKKYDLPTGSLRLEIAEGAFSEDSERLNSIISSIRAQGLCVEMDGFGSGLSSLHTLKDVSVDAVKLDRDFILSAVQEERGGVVLSSVIRMLQGLDTPITAVGVETLEQADTLKSMGCHLMQGYYFSRPIVREDFENYVETTHAVEYGSHREKYDSQLGRLLSFDPGSSYLFNHAMGGAMLAVVGDGYAEPLLVNDEFYEKCDLQRSQFGNGRVNPLQEIDEESRQTMWRAMVEAREHGSALCHIKVRVRRVWIDCVVNYLGESARGSIYAIIVIRSGEWDDEYDLKAQRHQDASWYVETLDTIAPNGFVKCACDDALSISYISPELYGCAGLSREEFAQIFHNSLIECVANEDRQTVIETVAEGRRTGDAVSCTLRMRHGVGVARWHVQMVGRVVEDEKSVPWFYAHVLEIGGSVGEGDAIAPGGDRVIAFDYTVSDDRLVVHMPLDDGSTEDTTLDSCLQTIESRPGIIAKASAIKLLATMRDLSHHPTAGFIDIKSDLRGSGTLRWYHVEYSCDADGEGNTTVVHGFARSANDQRDSARWWRRQAQTDQLTGLLNRNAVEEEINFSMHMHGAGMMFMIDLDGFKRVNDELGHLVGDALLRDVAAAIEGVFRDGDVVGRYGGDEFVAFMPLSGGINEDIAERRAADIVTAVQRVTAGDGTHAACSVGVALCSNPEATFYDLLEVADGAMYLSKERGKCTYTIVEVSS